MNQTEFSTKWSVMACKIVDQIFFWQNDFWRSDQPSISLSCFEIYYVTEVIHVYFFHPFLLP